MRWLQSQPRALQAPLLLGVAAAARSLLRCTPLAPFSEGVLEEAAAEPTRPRPALGYSDLTPLDRRLGNHRLGCGEARGNI